MCNVDVMPKVDVSAREWELGLSKRFGEAVARRRKALGLSAVQLWERTVELGYPITRIAISKIENNARVGKIDVAELLILGCALEIPPLLLLHPDYPDGEVEFLPGWTTNSERVVRWIAGEQPLPAQVEPGKGIRAHPENPGIELVRAADARSRLMHDTIRDGGGLNSKSDNIVALLNAYAENLAADELRIEKLSNELWGEPSGG
jgi:transcriptional regulator with XRE-family HTH domain